VLALSPAFVRLLHGSQQARQRLSADRLAMQQPLKLWPKQIGNQCLLMLAAGSLLGLLAPEQTHLLKPVATIFLQASQIVVMPYIISELIVGFGKLKPGSLKLLARRGGLALLGLWVLAGAVVIALPPFLPKLITSEFFSCRLV